MDKKKIYQRISSALIAILTPILAVRAADPPAPWSGELKELTTRLGLTDQQTQEVRRLLKMIDSQAQADRERCADDPRALIPAAEQRQQMEDRHLESVLEPEQIERYQEIREQRKRDWEYLYFREGLQLTDGQSVTLRAIFDEFNRKRTIMEGETKNHGDWRGSRGDRGPGGGRLGGGGTGFGMGRGMRGSSGPMGPEGSMREKAEAIEMEIAKRAKEILTPDQKKVFGDVQKMIQRKRESFREMFESSRQQRKMESPPE